MDADRAEIRKAYFALSKTFHPDAYYGKRLGSFKPKMEAVFRKVTDAYEAVGRTKKRRSLRSIPQAEHRSVRRRAADGPGRGSEPRPWLRRSPRTPVAERQAQPVVATAPSRRNGSPARRRPKRFLPLCREPPSTTACSASASFWSGSFGAGPDGSLRRGSRSVQCPVPTAKVGQKTALRDLTRSLKQTAVLTGGVDRADRHIEHARVAEADGDLAAAANALRMAIALDSSRTELQEQYQRVNSHLRVQLLDIHREQAKYEEDNNLWAAASISWLKVAQAAPDDAVAPRRAAKALMAAGGDLRKARDFALRSLELAPDSLETRLLLARVYIGAGMDASASKELEEAAKLDPEHEMVKNLRKQLGG